MSDIHGCYNEMLSALNHWNPKKEHLVILGDLIDRGPQSLDVIRHLMKLINKYPDKVTILKGNHDHMFSSWLMNTPYQDLGHYYNQDHNETLISFYGCKETFQKATRKQRGQHIIYNFKEELRFLDNLPYYLETEHIIFSHAGYDLHSENERFKNTYEMMWSRTFPYSSIPTPKISFFGHTPTPFLHENVDNYAIWMNDNLDRVCIDGGVTFGGQLNTLKVNNTGQIDETIIIPATNKK